MNTAHASTLQTRHADLDARIAEESGRPLPDAGLINELKRRKLRLKEELGRL